MRSFHISRRGFLLGAAATAGALATDAFGIEGRRVYITRHDVEIPRLPDALDGVRIAQVTDMHLHGGIHAAARATMELIQTEKPEITLLTGDACEHQSYLPDVTTFTRECRGSVATLALMGNWEYFVDISSTQAEAAYSAAGTELLLNRSRRIEIGNASLNIIGLDDPVRGKPDLQQTLKYALPADIQIWTYHAPGYADLIPPGIGPPPAFMLAGHTHGGQIRPPFIPPLLPVGSGRFVQGWYRDTLAPLYVSRGIGTTTIRARFRCPAELPVFVLRKGQGRGVVTREWTED
ncbi:MAG TPA: metallophosphoesterase [Gemmatimonadales bacterium]|nr:metallophosphoesterase [Gemmatimonadales bacterium]